jgi:uncharacterized protein (DUF362 family)
MKNRLNRRDFCLKIPAVAAGLGLFLKCDNRSTLTEDTRRLRAPAYLQATPDSCRVTLTWRPLDDPQCAGYRLSRADTGAVHTLAKTDSLFTDTLVLDGNTYTYHLTAFDTRGVESEPISAVTTLSLENARLVKVIGPTLASPAAINKDKVKEMIRAGLVVLTGVATSGDALRALLPGVTSTSKIGLKVNCLANASISANQFPCSTHWPVALAMAEVLRDDAGVMENNITIFEDRPAGLAGAGYVLNTSNTGFRVVVTPFAATAISLAGTVQHLSTVLLESDFIINIPILKDHNYAGITFALKNFYGCIDAPSTLHDNACAPIPELYNLPEIKNKTKLIVGEALYYAFNGGPAVTVQDFTNSIFLGTDPVAMDMYGLSVINTKRSTKGYLPISTSVVLDNHNPASHVAAAAAPPYSLGFSSYRLTTINVV